VAKRRLSAARYSKTKGGAGGAVTGALRRAQFAQNGAPPPFSLVLHEWADQQQAGGLLAGGGTKVNTRHVPKREAARIPPYRALADESGGVLIVAMHDTNTLRTLSQLLRDARDHVVEIGCSYGACSRAILSSCPPATFLGIDNSEECVASCQRDLQPEPRDPQDCAASSAVVQRSAQCAVRFERVDALRETERLCALVVQECPTLCVVDVGGIRAVEDGMYRNPPPPPSPLHLP
jgi:hypothetical protein